MKTPLPIAPASAILLLLMAGCGGAADEGCPGNVTVLRGTHDGLEQALSIAPLMPGFEFATHAPAAGVPVEGVDFPDEWRTPAVRHLAWTFLPPEGTPPTANYLDGSIWLKPDGTRVLIGAAMPARLTAAQRVQHVSDALVALAGLSPSAADEVAPAVVASATFHQAAVAPGPAGSSPAGSAPAAQPAELQGTARPSGPLSDRNQWDHLTCTAGTCQVLSGSLVMEVEFPTRSLEWKAGGMHGRLVADGEDRARFTVASRAHEAAAAWRLLNMTLAGVGMPGGASPLDWSRQSHDTAQFGEQWPGRDAVCA